MAPSKDDVNAMVAALFTLTAGMERARRQRKAAGTLSLLQLIDGRRAIRPSEIADLLQVHASLVTRQVRELEDAGHVQVAADPADGRSCLVTLTPAGTGELKRLTQAAWTGSPCSSRTGSPAMCGRSPRCWTSSGTPWLPSPRESSSSARPADVGQPLPDRISRTDWPSDGRPSAGAPCPARQNRHLGAAPRAKRAGRDWRQIESSLLLVSSGCLGFLRDRLRLCACSGAGS